MEVNEAKPGKNQFKCFNCRVIFSNKDGDWFNWDQMQVHLCKNCEKLTNKKAERGSDTSNTKKS